MNIYSPEDGDVFGITAPSFNITIIEKNFQSSWYSLDGGVSNFSILGEYGTINQTAWNNVPQGDVTIIFYVKDKAGNMVYKEITVTKRVPGISGYNLMIFIAFIGFTSIIYTVSTFKRKNKSS